MDLTGLDTELARQCELALVTPILRRSDVRKICSDAREIGAYGVCLPSSAMAEAYELLEDSGVKAICLVGFPFGASDSDVKRYETEVAIDSGVHEIELYLNSGFLKDGQHQLLLRELRDVCEAADERP